MDQFKAPSKLVGLSDGYDNSSTEDLYKFTRVGDNSSHRSEPLDEPLGDPLMMNNDTDSMPIYAEESQPEKRSDRYVLVAKVFFGISVTSALIILALESYIYAEFVRNRTNVRYRPKYEEISIYLALFIFATVFQVAVTIIGLLSKNLLLLVLLCVFYACMVAYTSIQYGELNSIVWDAIVGYGRGAIIGCNITAIVVLGWTLVLQVGILFGYLRKHVSWVQFKNIGGDIKRKRHYSVFQVHRALLIFIFFFFVGFTIQFITIMVEDKKSLEFILTVVVLPLTIILLILSDLAISKELLLLSIGCVMVYMAGIAYVLFKMVRLFTKYTSAYGLALVPGDYFPGRSSLMTFGSITVVFLLGIIVLEVILMSNFNRGLKDIVGHPRYLRMFSKQEAVVEEKSDELSIS